MMNLGGIPFDDFAFGDPHHCYLFAFNFFFSIRSRHTRYWRDWSSDVCSSDLHAALADLLADFLDRLVLEGAHGPVAGQPGDVAHEIANERRAVRRVHDFEMELRGVEFARVVADDGDRRIGRDAKHAEAVGQHRDAVAVAHPHGIFLALGPDAFEDRAVEIGRA